MTAVSKPWQEIPVVPEDQREANDAAVARLLGTSEDETEGEES